MTYEILDTEVSGYTASVRFELLDNPMILTLPGIHDDFTAAQKRARAFSAALFGMGETGLTGRVGYTGTRPPRFPRQGVDV